MNSRASVRLFLPTFVISLVAAGAEARTWHVRPDGTGDAPTIQAGIDSAAARDTVLVASGSYTWISQHASGPSMVRMKAGVILRGETGPAATLLDAEGGGRVLQCADVAGARIEGLSLVHGNGDFEGGGILSTGSSQLTITDCIIRDNTAYCVAGGISCRAGTRIRDCEILDNSAGCISGSGGGVACDGTEIVGCTIRGNGAGGQHGCGGGVFMTHSTLRECWIEGNVAGGTLTTSGGGVEAAAEDSILGCTFVDNRAGDGSALSFTSGIVRDCKFARNLAGLAGDFTVSTLRGSGTVTGCTLVGNAGYDGMGTTLLVQGAVTSTIVASNQAAGCGGHATYTCCDIQGNSLGDDLCGVDGGGNLHLDPQFCAVDAAQSLVFALQSDSPCAPGNHSGGGACGLIGAAPVGCGNVGVERSTWTGVKSLFR